MAAPPSPHHSNRLPAMTGKGHGLPPPIPVGGSAMVRSADLLGTFRGGGRAPKPVTCASESKSGTAADARRPAERLLVALSTVVMPSAQISQGPLRLPQCCFRFVESRRFGRIE